MKRLQKILVLLLMFVTFFSVNACGNLVESIDPGEFEEYTAGLFGTLIGNDELTIHYLFENKEAIGVEETTLSIPTPGSSSALGKMIINLYFGPIKNYDYDELNFDQQMTYNVIVDLLDGINDKTTAMNYLDNNYLGSYLGYQAQLPILLVEYRLDNLQDVENYFGLLQLIPEAFIEYVEYEYKKADAGYGMPDFVIDKVINQCVEFIGNDEHFLISTFENRIEHLELSDVEKEALIIRNTDIVNNSVKEGYAYVRDNLPNLRGRATNNLGLAHYETVNDDGTVTYVGKDYYEYLFKDATGYEVEMEEAIDYMQDHLEEIFQKIIFIMTNHPEAVEEAQNVVLMDCTPEEQVAAYKTLIQGHFPELESYPNITIKDIDPSMEDHFSPAAYIASPIDSFDEETIFLNQKKIDGDYNYLYTTLAHEGLPGHMYQNYYFKSQDVNIIRKVLKNSGYMEGWATYVELYSYNFVEDVSDEAIEYLRCYDILNGVLTARLDMGIHYEGWDIAETQAYLSQYFTNYDLENTTRVFEQLVEVPTNSQTYYYTYFKICDMRDRVMEALGSDYSALEFHKVILDCGPVPLRFVEDVVDDYIESKIA